MNKKRYVVYILLCNNDSYYVGYTTDLARRFQEHMNGIAKCKYTRSFKPLKIAQSWEVFGSLAMAMKVERHIKKMSKKNKEQLILSPDTLSVSGIDIRHFAILSKFNT